MPLKTLNKSLRAALFTSYGVTNLKTTFLVLIIALQTQFKSSNVGPNFM